jgi:hypothetical protein
VVRTGLELYTEHERYKKGKRQDKSKHTNTLILKLKLNYVPLTATISFRRYCGPGIDSASNRNVYQEYFLGVKAADV